MNLKSLVIFATALLLSTTLSAATTAIIKTSLGEMAVKLYDQQAPITTKNFIAYVNSGFYNDTIFHRVIPGFMVQGGGFEKGMVKKPTNAPIQNEAKPTTPNKRGTLSMARTNDPNSATAQFFINVVDNHFLNKSSSQAGYAVFGEIVRGMEVADQISATKTGRRGPYGDVPVTDIIIEEIRINK
ncbi:peptidylprolyl isomerase [Oleiphilus sp. HI0009]|uniref:peptidylprolyl isomerase n=1 Tax=unclassified Oleiphilus TaxID=2631174 RepID=UPI0007C31EE6|nr:MULTISPECIES: peptidylprolyl isomerase [unclassified Oleiphilus]KZX78169.1 peptidylprolyl isomerase [Oleiphilus sp. HI0009]KZX79249.1 peptidylprolyl isomerase [Oleiphilus sp. HI0009]KZY66066.1 peptidylprolyl isomerase [Oleiphilus sp. HI0066]KZY68678.1 peptidylprolyl isomerase [Oleiphilus sp. HI0067]